jgi:hypothetical protein
MSCSAPLLGDQAALADERRRALNEYSVGLLQPSDGSGDVDEQPVTPGLQQFPRVFLQQIALDFLRLIGCERDMQLGAAAFVRAALTHVIDDHGAHDAGGVSEEREPVLTRNAAVNHQAQTRFVHRLAAFKWGVRRVPSSVLELLCIAQRRATHAASNHTLRNG